MHERRNSRFGLWSTAGILILLLAYPLSFGPACWMADRGLISLDALLSAYAPLVHTMRNSESVRSPFLWYAGIGCEKSSFTPLILLITLSVEPSTSDFIDESDGADLPDADENVILDESALPDEPASESSIPRSSA
jgi:hypothetical protein